MDEAVRWLESPEGRRWFLRRGEASFTLRGTFGEIRGLDEFSVGLDEANDGIHEPRHDPRGRGPLGVTVPP